ncbi:hypothetical protein CBR_g50940 [Chara braunii]|uniref:Uncharacterized protein n=1 Tax=Chara braunii TaxID=69332 RepID=A0A388M7M7_CHABU|nr:hypothetical protein CBR_g50940 [Chara braunii]|eukprot:GBG90597.1 hypothetical protein CBR_g50940 [Chara braunii]
MDAISEERRRARRSPSPPTRVLSGATLGALDSNGKAIYGVPGPGTYDSVSTFGRQPVLSSAPTYKFGIICSKKVYVSVLHDKDTAGHESPGPSQYTPGPGLFQVKPRPPSFTFGSEEREKRQVGTTPGPGAYSPRGGKDAAAYSFWHGSQRPSFQEIERAVKRRTPGPGSHSPRYDLKLRRAPCYVFCSPTEPGTNRSRLEATRVFISGVHAQSGPSVLYKKEFAKGGHGYTLEPTTPGPGAYSVPTVFPIAEHTRLTDKSEAMRSPPQMHFGSARRVPLTHSKLYSGGDFIEPGMISPGPVHDIPSTFGRSHPTVKFGSGKRFFSSKWLKAKGRVKDLGPVVGASPEFVKELYGAFGPGPAKYNCGRQKNPDGTLKDIPAVKFGSEERPSLAKSGKYSKWIPGPGAYFPKKEPESLGHKCNDPGFTQVPSYSIASCLRTNFVPPGAEELPGPGTYETDTGFVIKDVRKETAPSFGFGRKPKKAKRRGKQPGPGAYTPHTASTFGRSGPAFSFGIKNAPPHSSSTLTFSRGQETVKALLLDRKAREFVGAMFRGNNRKRLSADEEALLASQSVPRQLNQRDAYFAEFDTPGPGSYTFGVDHAWKAMITTKPPGYKFGTSEKFDRKLMQGNPSPGPGAYVVTKDALVRTSSYKSPPGMKFGTGLRPPLATVVF